MTKTVLLDRVILAVVGVALAAGGVFAVRWARDPAFSGRPPITALGAAAQQDWWPWASGGVGLVLIALGLRWLAAHRWAPRAGRVTLPADGTASLTADVTSVAEAAADALADQPDVHGGSARATVERGGPTLTLTATVAARNALAAGARAGDDVAHTLAAMLGERVAVRTMVRVDARRRRAPLR